jgi:hypothetical protein
VPHKAITQSKPIVSVLYVLTFYFIKKANKEKKNQKTPYDDFFNSSTSTVVTWATPLGQPPTLRQC